MARKATMTATVRIWPLKIAFAMSELLRSEGGRNQYTTSG
jgi:hypothetical protein